jgi:hypothetical protein
VSSKVQEAALQGLHPTQLTVGMIVVQDKRKHLYANGVRHCYSMIPDSLDKLVDDVYRSLAGYVRDADGFDKTAAAYTEFIWADFFRRNIAVETVKSDF